MARKQWVEDSSVQENWGKEKMRGKKKKKKKKNQKNRNSRKQDQKRKLQKQADGQQRHLECFPRGLNR